MNNPICSLLISPLGHITVNVPALMEAAEADATPDEDGATADGAAPDEDAATEVGEVADEVAAAVCFAFDVQAASAAEPATMPAPLRKERLLTSV